MENQEEFLRECQAMPYGNYLALSHDKATEIFLGFDNILFHAKALLGDSFDVRFCHNMRRPDLLVFKPVKNCPQCGGFGYYYPQKEALTQIASDPAAAFERFALYPCSHPGSPPKEDSP